MEVTTAGTGMEDDDISFLTDTDLDEDDRPPPVLPKYTTEEREDIEKPKKPQGLELSKALAIKGISKVSLNRKQLQKADRHLGKVVSLHLQKRGIQILVPDVLESFYSLAHLYLYGNKICKIQGLEALPQLESLHLYENRIRRIENLENCTNLRRLYLGQNEIEVIEGLGSLSMLLELHVEDQRLPPEQALAFCPNSMDTICNKLKVLSISGNQLESIDELICMGVLDTLYASRNNFRNLNHVTSKLSVLRLLRVVDLRHSPITKDPKYKERLVGHLQNIEMLDTKDINATTKCFLQRLCSVKAMRMRRPDFPMNMGSQSRTNINQSPTSNFYPSVQTFPSQNRHFNSNVNVPPRFQFSTPISASPIPDQQQQLSSMYPFTSMPQEIQGQRLQPQAFSKVPSRLEIEKSYHSRSTNELEVENDPERMSEMAKIIFRLSNLSPSAEEVGTSIIDSQSHGKNQEGSYWDPTAMKESRPLSPLEPDDSLRSSPSLSPLGSRKSAPMRRPMARKLPPRNSVGAGRTLSPLEELATPDSLIKDALAPSQKGDWIGQALKTSTCTLPPWLNSRKKSATSSCPSKVGSLP